MHCAVRGFAVDSAECASARRATAGVLDMEMRKAYCICVEVGQQPVGKRFLPGVAEFR